MNIYCIRNSVASNPKGIKVDKGIMFSYTICVCTLNVKKIICGKWNDTFIMSIFKVRVELSVIFFEAMFAYGTRVSSSFPIILQRIIHISYQVIPYRSKGSKI